MINQFSKKINIILYLIVILSLSVCTFLIIKAPDLLFIIQDILENKVFHRTFSLEKWADTINSLIAFPVFFVVFFEAVLFPKYSDTFKLIHILTFTVLTLLITCIASAVNSDAYMTSDMASELLLAKECYLQKSLLPRTWFYSTELRVLNTQIISAPLFIFTKNLKVIKMLTVLFCTVLLPASLYYLLNSLKVTKKWLVWLGCLLITAPFSMTMWFYVQFGNYYIPHICLAFIYTGLFINLFFNDYKSKQFKILFSIFLILSFICGVSGIRYLLYFVFPLFLTQTIYFLNTEKELSGLNFKSIFIQNKNNYYSCLSLICCIAGYLFNNLILSRIYTFSSYNTTTFTRIGDVTFSDLHSFFLRFLGYKNEVSVFTPSGIINILLYVFYVSFFIILIKELKNKVWNPQKYFIIFSLVLSIFNGFVMINTEYTERYLSLFLIFIIPLVILLFFINKNQILKYLMLFSFSVSLITSSFISQQTVFCCKDKAQEVQITDFLLKNDFHYGYGTFENANIFNYLSNDKIQMGNINHFRNENNMDQIPDTFDWDKWLTPARYYTENFGENQKVFFIVLNIEYNQTPEANIFLNGDLIYNDDKYRIYQYESNNDFIDSFKKIKD